MTNPRHGPGAPVRALLLDFDGTMLETESSSYGSWRELLSEHGYDLTAETWSAAVGTIGGVDPVALLETHLGEAVDGAQLRARQARRHREMLAREALRPGVEQLTGEARARGLHTAIVTSASRSWVLEHLSRLEIAADWELIVAADGDPARAKPDPLLYREAARELGIEPSEAVVIEDSPNGISAAKAAGMTCIAFPNAVTAVMDLEAADAVVADLDGLDLDALLGMVGRRAVSAPSASETGG